MYIIRRWATRNSRPLEILYRLTGSVFHAFDPVWHFIGAARLERPFAAIEGWAKGVVFDCSMCGRCQLSVTGMTCVMNCPKTIHNGPCGGVRANGNCEVKAEMRCVWVEAWDGAQRMHHGMAIRTPQPPRDHAIKGTSAWLRLSAENMERRRALGEQARESAS
ncbi:MAG: hypothetical protein HOL66_05320 [Rhodospirillaceae bacterium]|jgi:hypothetical protein|nr:hypothetical protein [Rhodospirillaceae bacterium]MBT5243643.1 hypothetical protein [Rhodospirillaceae bacterium]MBT5561977.1 hypothetical protein [Rhodospirillaceae bacterium]MBT6240400.1 hypothetical protein [Rhodospirillaceae bacterium]